MKDVVIRELKTYMPMIADSFANSSESPMTFSAEGFGQWSHSLMFDGVIKAWHLHRIQTDWWYVVNGVLRVGLCDMRIRFTDIQNVMDLLMGDLQTVRILKIPPGVAHGCKTIQGPVNLFYVTSHVYNPDDEVRLPYNDPEIDFDWLKGPQSNDGTTFPIKKLPAAIRSTILDAYHGTNHINHRRPRVTSALH